MTKFSVRPAQLREGRGVHVRVDMDGLPLRRQLLFNLLGSCEAEPRAIAALLLRQPQSCVLVKHQDRTRVRGRRIFHVWYGVEELSALLGLMAE